MRRCDRRPPTPCRFSRLSSFCGAGAARATPAAPRRVTTASPHRQGRGLRCAQRPPGAVGRGPDGNLKDSTGLEVTGYEPANSDAMPAEQLSARCAPGPQAKRSPGGAGARKTTLRRTAVKARPIDRPDPPRNSPKSLANSAGAQRDRQHSFRAWPLAALRNCTVHSRRLNALGALGRRGGCPGGLRPSRTGPWWSSGPVAEGVEPQRDMTDPQAQAAADVGRDGR
jgi:hypothetical protein